MYGIIIQKFSQGGKMISIILPTKNEEATIGQIIDSVKPFCNEIIVVDGHSQDKTQQIAVSHGAKYVLDNGKGKGDGLRVGINTASGDTIVFMDADGSHDPKDIPRLVQPIIVDKADMVVGCRMTGGSDELHGDIGKFIRFMGSMIITLIINYRWGVRLTDVQNGFRAIRKEAAKNINLLANDFTIEEEMVMKCLRKKYMVINVPAHEYARKVGKSRIVISKVWFSFGWVVIKNVIGLSSITPRN
jgi:dolichol-phosphate mannosyltransferase